MRAVLFALCLLPSLALPFAAQAETILATSQITAVTVYPDGAEVSRVVRFDAPAGTHEVLITDLPAETAPGLLRLQAEGLTLGAFALRAGRLPPRDVVLTPAQQTAKAEVERSEAAAHNAGTALAQIDAAVAAAEAQAGFLTGIRGGTGSAGEAVTAEGLQSIARMIGAEVLAARQTALTAGEARPAAEKLLQKADEALEKARAALAALDRGDEDYALLSVQFTAATAGPSEIRIRHYVDANWRPVYDIDLRRSGDATLELSRGALVSQYSGEDWAGVALTLSTAQPSDQSAASPLAPQRREIYDPEAESLRMSKAAGGSDGALMLESMAEPVAMAPVSAMATFQGDVVVYAYPLPVDVASGVEDLRLALDKLQFAARIEARAVPRADQTAFLLAHFVNESPEIILPGMAFLLRDGVLVNSTELAAIAPGEAAELGFGPIEGLRLRRDEPERAEGDRGILITSTQIEEKAVLRVENLTTEAWPLRLLDLVPYSEQEDLSVTFTAEPAPSEENVDGQRGILAWDFDLAPGGSKEISLTHVLTWPEGMDLR